VIRIISDITENMSQGEIHQLMRKGAFDLSENEYMEVIRRKTAVLFQGACRVSAVLADASGQKKAGLSEYGHHLGMAFQMADDLLDYTAQSSLLGKHVGADLREGKITLPIIHALKNASQAEADRMVAIIGNPDFSNTDFDELLSLLTKRGGIAYAQKLAADHIDRAKSALSVFASSSTKDILLDVADYALARSM
jgi:octaprenyl-diphosphate synthase